MPQYIRYLLLLGDLELLLRGLVVLLLVAILILIILTLLVLIVTQQRSLTPILQPSRIDLPVPLLGFMHDLLRLPLFLLLDLSLLHLDLPGASDLVLLREPRIRVHEHRYSIIIRRKVNVIPLHTSV